MPPSAGPAIAPVCQAVELRAMALGRISRGTRLGAIAPSAGPAKARATPSRAATPNRIGRLMNPPQVAPSRISAQSSSSRITARATWRRSSRSAVQPLIGVRTNRGTNWTRPIRPSWNAACVDVHRLAGDVIDLPADDDDHRHLADGGRQPGQPEGPEVGDSKRLGDQRHRRAVAAGMALGNGAGHG